MHFKSIMGANRPNNRGFWTFLSQKNNKFFVRRRFLGLLGPSSQRGYGLLGPKYSPWGICGASRPVFGGNGPSNRVFGVCFGLNKPHFNVGSPIWGFLRPPVSLGLVALLGFRDPGCVGVRFVGFVKPRFAVAVLAQPASVFTPVPGFGAVRRGVQMGDGWGAGGCGRFDINYKLPGAIGD